MSKPKPLKDKVILVAGATRGAGRGIAVQLGAAGAKVYVTGRSTRGKPSEFNRPETIEQTAEMVTEAGGTGIAVALDHLEAEQVKSLIVQIETDSGRLDVLVNDIWGGDIHTEWGKPVWEHTLDAGLKVLRLAIDTHIITSHYALPLLIQHKGGLLIEITDGTIAHNAKTYRSTLFYDLAKTSVSRMAWGLAQELKPYGCTALSLTPGWLRSEMMLEGFGVREENWRDAIQDNPSFARSETPHYIGRAVAHLVADSEVNRFNGLSLSSGQLAKEYGFTDLDGSQPDFWAEEID
ncbi:MAG: SDR family oxidoreductase [Deinococcota bacterium]